MSKFVCCLATVICLFVVPVRALCQAKPLQTCIPKLAGLLVGYDDYRKPIKLFGQGLAVTGEQPEGARVWRIKHSGWLLYAEGFYYGDPKNGYVIDHIYIDSTPTWVQDAPVTTVSKSSVTLLGGITIGTRFKNALSDIRLAGFKPMVDGQTVSFSGREGSHPVPEITYTTWTVSLSFNSRNVVDGIDEEADGP